MRRALAVPATGIVDYITLEIDLGLTEDRWVRATEIVPGNRTLVHHAQAVIGPPGKAKEIECGTRRILALCRLRARPGPFGPARRHGPPAPAGWHLYLTMHYVTTGLAGSDQTSIGMIFTDNAANAVYTHNIITDQFTHSAVRADRRVEQNWTVPSDILVLALFPHMHLRGRSFTLRGPLSQRRTGIPAQDSPLRFHVAAALRAGTSRNGCPPARSCEPWPSTTIRPPTRPIPIPRPR